MISYAYDTPEVAGINAVSSYMGHLEAAGDGEPGEGANKMQTAIGALPFAGLLAADQYLERCWKGLDSLRDDSLPPETWQEFRNRRRVAILTASLAIWDAFYDRHTQPVVPETTPGL